MTKNVTNITVNKTEISAKDYTDMTCLPVNINVIN